jgi:hypothetical protein
MTLAGTTRDPNLQDIFGQQPVVSPTDSRTIYQIVYFCDSRTSYELTDEFKTITAELTFQRVKTDKPGWAFCHHLYDSLYNRFSFIVPISLVEIVTRFYPNYRIEKCVNHWKWAGTWSPGHALARNFHGDLVLGEWKLWYLWMTRTNELTIRLTEKYADLTAVPDNEKGDLAEWMAEIHMTEMIAFYSMLTVVHLIAGWYLIAGTPPPPPNLTQVKIWEYLIMETLIEHD